MAWSTGIGLVREPQRLGEAALASKNGANCEESHD
jgi:hypothetical protein